jgi:hypothetical protein
MYERKDIMNHAKGFEGWYFKHQSGNATVAFIVGRAESGAFVQVLTDDFSQQFPINELRSAHGLLRADNCLFSHRGCRIMLPDLHGCIRYHALSPLHSDIMGPFRFFPMECRHSVISMMHTLEGTLQIGTQRICFDGGTGYIEGDCGTSFPSSYLWMQCNRFAVPCSVMVAVANIPFAGTSFTGCIAAILFNGREYRFATYRGVHILAATAQHICLSQGSLLFEADLRPADQGHALAAPHNGRMTAIIRETHRATVRCRLWCKGKLVFDLRSEQGSLEVQEM